VERALVAYNRFALFGDTASATVIGKAFVKREGNEFEIVPGPKDNNRIGTGTWMALNAYRVFRSRSLELTLIRMFDGLVFLEAVTGHSGMTVREAYPGWTREVDGDARTTSRMRGGAPASSPVPAAAELEGEIIDTFFAGFQWTYREDPAEFLFSFAPVAELEDYAITYSFSALPAYLHASDCCSSLMRTPEDRTWAGAYWGNHNSRDNFPDLALGIIAAQAAVMDAEASEDVRAAAQRAVEAGRRIGDFIGTSRNNLMTVDEWGDYDTFTVGGTVRPHGEMENQDLGSLGVCSMAYLAKAMSTSGLAAPIPTLPLPGSGDKVFADFLPGVVECPVPEGEVQCTSLEQAYCGRLWSTMHQVPFLGQPFLEYLHENPESAPLFVSFQNDFDDVAESMLGLLHYARLVADDDLTAQARSGVFYLTWLMQEMADTVLANQPEKRRRQRYQAALYAAQAHLPAVEDDFEGFARAESEVAQLETLLTLADTAAAPLLTDEEILQRIEDELVTERDVIIERYRSAYGSTPPVRRVGDGYEARGVPEADHPWHPVERPQHTHVGGFRLLHALPLCELAPQYVDCGWAVLGCERPDLNADGRVDVADQTLFEESRTASAGTTCSDSNAWCGGSDLDRDGLSTDSDEAMMAAADGCFY
jgi:hypothetical protein